MAEFKALTSGVEINGETTYSIVDGMGVFRICALEILAKYGITKPKKGFWYSQQAWLDSFKEISAMLGPTTLFAIGKKIPANAIFPPSIDNIDKALQAIDVAYHMNHRLTGVVMFNPGTGKMLEGIGHYQYNKIGDNKVKMFCDNPYPCEFDRGIIEAMAQKFKSETSSSAVTVHDDSCPCRRKGGDSCTYHVTW
ncbi:MAG: hypothetical protein HQM08_11090 [Candidatus Riflebacteria bacterium]|nr:hypothetical protein [Candidatus Riflebacteria bacterium]